MNKDLTEGEMRRALFGNSGVSAPVYCSSEHEADSESVVMLPVEGVTKKRVSKAFTPRLRVTLRVGNEFEGEMHEIIHEADMLSTLLAELEATKVARKKFRFVEVISVKSM